jgi:hypothetical protein
VSPNRTTRRRKYAQRPRLTKEHIAYKRLALLLGFAIGIVALVIGCITALYGQAIAGSLIGTGGVTCLVSVFVRATLA